MQISDAPLAIVRAGLFALVAGFATAIFPAQADDLQDAARLLKAGQHPQALERVNRILATKPRDAQARFLKGLIFTEQGNTKEAIEIFTRLTQDFPELPEPYNNLAVIYAAQGQYERARTALEQSIRTHPSYATAYENLGDVYAKLASQAYDKALQLDSSNTAAQNKLSLVRELVRGPATTVAAAREPAKPPVVLAQKPAAPPEKAPPPVAQKPAEKAPVPEKAATAERPVQAEKPPVVAEKPAATPKLPVDASAEIARTLNGWAQAWSKQDVDAYLGYYARDFRPPGGESRADWEKVRRARIAAPKSIAVTVASPKVTMNGANEATVTFRQSYRSDLMKANSTKTMVFVRGADGRWLIQQEKAG